MGGGVGSNKGGLGSDSSVRLSSESVICRAHTASDLPVMWNNKKIIKKLMFLLFVDENIQLSSLWTWES